MVLSKNYFLKYGGDDYYNRSIVLNRNLNYKNDPVIKFILKLKKKKIKNLIEIGCGDGSRLSYIQNNLGIKSFGIDPSAQAIRNTSHIKNQCKIATADKVPYSDNKFDLIIFGQSLMYFDDDLLTSVVNETYRILRKKSYILINDFYSNNIKYKKYKYYKKIKIRKMNNSMLFIWHPRIELIKEVIYSYKNSKIKNNRVSIHLLKCNKNNS